MLAEATAYVIENSQGNDAAILHLATMGPDA